MAYIIMAGNDVCLGSDIVNVDRYCIDRGVLVDSDFELDVLENPCKHSIHCLVDVDICSHSKFEVLAASGPNGHNYIGPRRSGPSRRP